MVDLNTRPGPPSPASRVEEDRPPRFTDPRRRSDRFAPGNARWLLTALLWVTLVTATASLHPLFQGVGWWFVSSFIAALVLGASALARAAHWPNPAAFVAGLVVAGLSCTVVVSGGTAVLGVLPTAETFDRIRVLAAQARDAIISDQAPVPVDAAMLAVIAVSVAAAALLIDLVARVGRLPGLVGVLFAVILVVPSLVPDVSPSWPWVVATVLAFIALLIVSTGRRPSRASVLAGFVAVLVAGIATSLLPVSLMSPLTGVGTGSGISTGVNPVINLGNDLRRGQPVNVLTYRTSAPDGTYLKLVDLVNFSGTSWSPAPVTLNNANNVTKLPAAPGIAPSTRRSTVTTNVSVSLLRSPYLPLPVPATTVTGIDNRWKYVDASGVTIRSTSEGSQGLDYKVVSKPVDPTKSQIVASLGAPPKALAPYLDVKGVPSSITRLAQKVTAKAANPFDAAVDLQDYFRDGGFTYSEKTPVAEGYDGSGLDMVETFLQRKSGYCVHFASAMAVMARTLGIPSRIAVGFLPGEEVGSTDEWTVTSNDLHTWPELYFQGLGWVPFEPTVGQGTTSNYLQQTEVTPSPVATASPSTSATAAPTDAPSQAATPTAPVTNGVTPPSSDASVATDGTGISGSAFLTFGIALLIALGLVPWYLRAARRRRRLGVGPPDAALEAWREVVDTARDLGAAVDPGATPQVTAALIRGALDPSGAQALDMLLGRVEAERFGGRPADDDVHDDARRVIAALRASSPVGARLAATLAPRSLFVEARQRTAD